ncbi:radical SAM protein [Enorma massiliensis]|uniref:radical SAM protein n=1 Tax=Enorma massiliensis TaxID=1472761 RepID=UPI003207C54F
MIVLVDKGDSAGRVREMVEMLRARGADKVDIVDVKTLARQGMPAERTKVLVPWGLRMAALHVSLERDEMLPYVLWHRDFCFDIEEKESLRELIAQHSAEGNVKLMKDLNEAMMLSDVLHRRSRPHAMPLKLQVESTDRCNAHCIMCGHAYSPGSGTDAFRDGVVSRLTDALPFVQTMILHGNGEPFLSHGLIAHLEELSAFGVSFITSTNLSVLPDGIIDHLRDQFVELIVSCDAASRELYERIRPGLSFERFCANVRQVRAACPDLRMKMAVVVMRQNIDICPDIVSFASDLGFDGVVFNQLCPDPRCGNLEDVPTELPERYQEAMRAARIEGERRGIAVKTPSINCMISKKMRSDKGLEDGDESEAAGIAPPRYNSVDSDVSGICDWLVDSAYIDARGNVAPCCMLQQEVVGNVFDHALAEIWRGDACAALRGEFYRGSPPEACSGCDFLLQGRLSCMLVRSLAVEGSIKHAR